MAEAHFANLLGPPVVSSTVPPFFDTSLLSNSSLINLEPIFSLDLSDFCWTKLWRFSCMLCLLHLWTLPLPLKPWQRLHLFSMSGWTLDFFRVGYGESGKSIFQNSSGRGVDLLSLPGKILSLAMEQAVQWQAVLSVALVFWEGGGIMFWKWGLGRHLCGFSGFCKLFNNQRLSFKIDYVTLEWAARPSSHWLQSTVWNLRSSSLYPEQHSCWSCRSCFCLIFLRFPLW